MRVLAFLLVLANVLLFALAGGFSGGDAPLAGTGGATRELSADRIRIVSRGEPPAVTLAPVHPVASACVEWPDLAAEQADRLAETVEGTGVFLTRNGLPPKPMQWWVHIPPPPNGKAGVGSKVGELKRLGVTKYSVVDDDTAYRYAISLGRFPAESDAKALLGDLRQKGIRSARIMAVNGGESRERVVVRGPQERILALTGEFHGGDSRACENADEPRPVLPSSSATAAPDTPVKPSQANTSAADRRPPGVPTGKP